MRLPGLVGFEHGIEHDQQLAHAGNDGNFFRFARLHEAGIEGLQYARNREQVVRCNVGA